MNGTAQHDVIVEDYLQRLERAAWALSPERRAELVLEIRDHIADARMAAGESTDEAWTRTLLDRLGTPEEIVAAASDGIPIPPPPWGAPPSALPYPPPPVTYERRPGTGLELTAVLFLTVGSIIPFLGWIVGVVLLWSSRRWRTWEKVLGTLIVPGGPFAVLFIAIAIPGQVCSTTSSSTAAGSSPHTTTTCTGFALHPVVGIPVFLFALIGPIIVAGWLYSRAKDRAAVEAPEIVVVPAGRTGSPWGGMEIAAVVLLAVGSFVLPFIGPLVGLILAWSSSAWTTAEKWIATAICAAGVLLPVVVFIGFFGAMRSGGS